MKSLDLHRIHFITRHFSGLQGLRLWAPWGLIVLGVGGLADPVDWPLACLEVTLFLAAFILMLGAKRYYRVTLGEVEPVSFKSREALSIFSPVAPVPPIAGFPWGTSAVQQYLVTIGWALVPFFILQTAAPAVDIVDEALPSLDSVFISKSSRSMRPPWTRPALRPDPGWDTWNAMHPWKRLHFVSITKWNTPEPPPKRAIARTMARWIRTRPGETPVFFSVTVWNTTPLPHVKPTWDPKPPWGRTPEAIALTGGKFLRPMSPWLAQSICALVGSIFLGVWRRRECHRSQRHYLILAVLLLGLAVLGACLGHFIGDEGGSIRIINIFLPVMVFPWMALLLCGSSMVLAGLADHWQLVQSLGGLSKEEE